MKWRFQGARWRALASSVDPRKLQSRMCCIIANSREHREASEMRAVTSRYVLGHKDCNLISISEADHTRKPEPRPRVLFNCARTTSSSGYDDGLTPSMSA